MMISVLVGVTLTSTAVTILGELTGQELVEFSLEHTVVHELTFLGNLDCH